MKLLFIDSNIFLNFYHFYDEDLDQLSKLVELIKKREIKLYVTTQVHDEIKRNRENRLEDAYKKFSESECVIKMPIFCKHYDEYADIKRAQQLLRKIKSSLDKKIFRDIGEKNLKADKIINDLIFVSTIIESDKYLPKAITRYRLGRPPGKNKNSCGDEVNWEALIAEIKEDGEFIIISEDNDYINCVDKNKLKDYLIDEWKEHNNNEIFFYKSLGSFFREHDIKIELKIEQEKDDLINELNNSSNFSTTHTIISQLSKYDNFSDEQIKQLVVALQNSQVSWIIDDPDINQFYKKYLDGKSDIFETEEWDILQGIVNKDNEKDVSALEEIKELEDKYDEDCEITEKDIPF
jgi:predicted nucleic acid-binding protein